MKQHLNTLFVNTQGAYLRKEGEAVVVSVERETKLRVPLHNLGGIVCFGRVGASPALLGKCADAGVAVSFLTESGRLQARVLGFSPGNVLLRREQYRRTDDDRQVLTIVQPIVLAKLRNSRSVLLRATRDYPDAAGHDALVNAAQRLAAGVDQAEHARNPDQLRGIEGESASIYFDVFAHLITRPANGWRFDGRSRRPPRDPVNALLSFLYTMLVHDARSACEAAGLDSQVGFLHRDRPGRPSLALDLMEEFRATVVDSAVITAINTGMVTRGDVIVGRNGCTLKPSGRKGFIRALEARLDQLVTHPVFDYRCAWRVCIRLQAQLLARHLRGDVPTYHGIVTR